MHDLSASQSLQLFFALRHGANDNQQALCGVLEPGLHMDGSKNLEIGCISDSIGLDGFGAKACGGSRVFRYRSLTRRRNQDGIDDLTRHGDVTSLPRSAVDFELFRRELSAALSYTERTEGGRPPFDPVLMFKILVIQATNNLSDERAQFLIINRLSFMRFQVDRPDRSAASTDQSCGTRIATRAGRSNKPRADGSTPTVDLAIPLFGYQNHVSIDRRFGFIRRWAATEAAYEGRRRYRLPIGGRGSAKVPGWQSWKTLVSVYGISLLCWRSGGVEHPHDTPPYPHAVTNFRE